MQEIPTELEKIILQLMAGWSDVASLKLMPAQTALKKVRPKPTVE